MSSTETLTDRISKVLAGNTDFTFYNAQGMHHRVNAAPRGLLVIGGFHVISHHFSLDCLVHTLKPTFETIRVTRA